VNISKLRELERAATTPQWDREVRAAIASLLKVAEAANRLVNPGTLPACLTEQARFHTQAMVALGEALAELERA